MKLRHNTSARLRSSCSEALDMRVISVGRAPTSFAVSRQVAVMTATSLMTARAAAMPRPKYPEAASRRSIEQVPSSRSIFVVRTDGLSAPAHP